jgi:hypothetical protein
MVSRDGHSFDTKVRRNASASQQESVADYVRKHSCIDLGSSVSLGKGTNQTIDKESVDAFFMR